MATYAMERIGLATLFLGGALIAAPLAAQADEPSDGGLAAGTLASGENLRAIAILKGELERYPDDPALQINLGIALAQIGNEDEARENFRAAMGNRDQVDVETADGRVTDSRRLARLALSMLERGEFRETQTFASK